MATTRWLFGDQLGDSFLDSSDQPVLLVESRAVFRRRRFFAGDAKHGGKSELGDIEWFRPDGHEMDDGYWNSGFARSLMVFLNGWSWPRPRKSSTPGSSSAARGPELGSSSA